MYLKIIKKINLIALILFALLALLVYFTYTLIDNKIVFGFVALIIAFVLYYILFFIKVNLETYKIYKMVSKKEICLAKVIKATFFKTVRDFNFVKHNVYKFDLELYLKDGSKVKKEIYEWCANEDFSMLPANVYVTYNGNDNNIGIVPTYTLYTNPVVKDMVKEYEDKYHPTYIEVKKKQGLEFKKFKVKE